MTTTRYEARAIGQIDNGPGCWKYQRIGVFLDGVMIGEYVRNYPSLMRTFCYFRKNDKDYALYSSDYTATRVMALPSCEDLGGEDRDTWGFCPVDYCVPYECTEDSYGDPEFYEGNIGFVSGCVWGDDSSWKVQFLDLTRVEEGIIKRDDRFGYIELFGGLTLCESIIPLDWPNVVINCGREFSVITGGEIR